MIKENINYSKGFTLIEMVIYIALFSIIMGGLISTVYLLTQSMENTSKKTAVQEEMNFVLKKLDWALAGATKINSPLSGTSTSLSLQKTNYVSNPIVIKLNASVPTKKFIEIQTGSNNPFYPLTTQNVKVENLIFEYIAGTGTGPAGIKATIIIEGKSITIIGYLRV